VARKQRCPECKAGSPAWMSTFSDMNSLLMTFFIALVAMSTLSPGKFQQVSVGIQTAFKSTPPGVLTGGKSLNEEPLVTMNAGIRQEILHINSNPKYKGKITVKETNQGLLVELHNMAFFKAGSAELTAEAKELLSEVGKSIIEHSTNPLWVYGYTTDLPLPKDSIYPSKWHLSAARSASVIWFFLHELKNVRSNEEVVKIMNGQFDPNYWYDSSRFVAIGLGEEPMLKRVKSETFSVEQKLQALRQEYASGQIDYKQLSQEASALNAEISSITKKVRDSYRRVDILIKKQGE
jgi:chemotaxis protein MotB